MQHIKQEKHECVLASVACVLDLPYRDVRSYARLVANQLAQVSEYHEIFKKPAPQCRAIIQTIVQRFGIKPSLFGPYKPSRLWSPIQTLVPSRLYGRGFIFQNTEMTLHVLAFENGIVYDSNYPKALPLADWKALRIAYSGHITVKIVRNYLTKG